MPSPHRATAGKVVSIHYTLTSSAGDLLDRSGDEPLAYLHGHENIVPGLERQLEGKAVGDKLKAVVEPAEGYGEKLPGGPQPLPRDAFPEDLELEEGMQLAAQMADGQVVPLWIAKVEGDQILVDPNHPLAGETLTFDVEITEIRDATEEERTHGHVHGPGGAHD